MTSTMDLNDESLGICDLHDDSDVRRDSNYFHANPRATAISARPPSFVHLSAMIGCGWLGNMRLACLALELGFQFSFFIFFMQVWDEDNGERVSKDKSTCEDVFCKI